MPSPPPLPLFVDDFRDGTADAPNERVGAYLRFLMFQWKYDGVPDDVAARAAILCCRRRDADRLWSQLRDKFPPGPDGLPLNRKLERVRAWQRRGRDGGRLLAIRRWYDN